MLQICIKPTSVSYLPLSHIAAQVPIKYVLLCINPPSFMLCHMPYNYVLTPPFYAMPYNYVLNHLCLLYSLN
jgi:hypothetical protein